MTEVLLIGFGEAGRAFAEGWRAAEVDATICAYDIKLRDRETEFEIRQAAEAYNVRTAMPGDASYRNAELVLSLVTADQALQAARETVSHLRPGQQFWDLNSVAPRTKVATAELFAGTGAVYLDVAVLAPVHPKRHRVPLAISGPDSATAAETAENLDLDADILSGEIGDAATLKLLRSIIVKGMEALLLECHEGCLASGMRERVLASLAASFPGIHWPQRADYVLDRVARHGGRRAAEMREAALMLQDLGVEPMMTHSVADRLSKGISTP